MPHGKPAGVRCVQLTPDLRCGLFGRPERPAVCASLRASPDMCGASATDAFARLARLEMLTCAEKNLAPDRGPAAAPPA